MSKEVQIARRPDGNFDVSHGNATGHTETTYPVLDFPKDSGPQVIVFKLASGSERFNPADPIWVSDVEKPKEKSTDDQIIDAMVFDAGKTLVVLNKNSEAGKLYYNLNMVRNEEPIDLDPVITNGGGGSGITLASYALIGAVVSAFLTVMFVRFVMKWHG